MAISNRERVGRAMDLLRDGLGPYIAREVHSAIKQGRVNLERVKSFSEDPKLSDKPLEQWDVQALLNLAIATWNDVFKATLGHTERSYVGELKDWRNKWAHQEPFSSDDTDRALDSMVRLLTAMSAPQADEVDKMKKQLRRETYESQRRTEERKNAGDLIESAALGTLAPWRDIAVPHPDVASGRYQQAEFAADLWQVHLGEGADEYRIPVEFFRRTFLTQSLRTLLRDAIQRLSGKGGNPVVQLQTNFGGGKTHSMLALLHLFAGKAKASELVGVDEVLADAGATTLPVARPVVLVGNKISPGNPTTKPDGTVVRTLWGELAWQLGGKEAYARIAKDDERATSPGDELRKLFVDYGPALILIDEWVAYARQLHDQGDLPGGSFETQFSFAQALTESAKLAGNCLLVISLPASDTATSPHAEVDDVEVGGVRGREALQRLQNVVGRLESSWRPATAEEGFEIVRRRLFQPLATEAFPKRDVTARAFAELYRTNASEFPPEARAADYEKRLQAAYPIHPELFDRLYGDWSTLVKFQRTRGVLRLMAAVIHSLWERGDRSPLILPATVPLDDPRVSNELTRYLSDNWKPIVERDIDGPTSLPVKIDGEQPSLGKLSATRRVARTVFMGSAPGGAAAQRGIEDRQVRLGCVMPGETIATFGDALRRLAATATYLYQDGARVWYDTRPTVTKLADDRAEQYRRDPDAIAHELEERIRADIRRTGDFARVHALPVSGADVPDDHEARLVILLPRYPHTKDGSSPAQQAAQEILTSRGNAPRLFRNTLVFLAVDAARVQDLDEAIRRFLAWRSIHEEREVLGLTPQQLRQVETQREAASSTITARLPETYQWLIVPTQDTPQSEPGWEALNIRQVGGEALAVRASKKLKTSELLITVFGGTRLKRELDRVPLWRGDHVPVAQLAEDFARYLYLPRLVGPEVLRNAVQDGVQGLAWEMEAFAYADRFNEATGRYEGLVGGRITNVSTTGDAVLVKPDAARRQLDATADTASPAQPGSPAAPASPAPAGSANPSPAGQRPEPKRYFGSVNLDSDRIGRDAGRIAEEVVSHLAGLVGSRVRVTLEIEAEVPNGVPSQVVRTVLENGKTLKFQNQGFEES